MLKNTLLLLLVCLLASCVTEPSDKSFRGAGEFDAQEAAKTRVSLGLTYLKNGNFSQAKFNLDKALEFAPKSGEAHYAMAFYYQQVDEYERADSYYISAIDYSRNDPDVLNSYGAFLCQQSKYEKAKQFFLRAVDDKSYISAAETFENLAICTHSQGYIDEAIKYFNSALNHQPTRASSLLYLAELQAEKGQWAQAKRSLWKYERNGKVSPQSLFLSHQIANSEQDTQAALKYAEILQSMYPKHEKTQIALSQLGKFRAGPVIVNKNVASNKPLQTQNSVGLQNAVESQVSTPSSTEQVVLEQVEASDDIDDGAALKNVEQITPEQLAVSVNQPLEDSEQDLPQSALIETAQNAGIQAEQVIPEAQTQTDTINELSDNAEISIATALADEGLDNTLDEPQQVASAIDLDSVDMDSVDMNSADIDAQNAETEDEIAVKQQNEQEEQLQALFEDEQVQGSDSIQILATANDVTEQASTTNDAKAVLKDLSEQTKDMIEGTTNTVDSSELSDDLSAVDSYHIVQAKENLYRLSLKYNVTVDNLLQWNNLSDKSSIKIGTKLWVRDPNINE